MHPIRFFFASLLISVSLGTVAQTQPAVVEQLLRDSGTQEQINILSKTAPSSLTDELSKLTDKLSASEKERIHKQITLAFDSERMTAYTVSGLSKRLQPGHAASALKWYGTKSGKTVRQAEELASQEQAQMTQESLLPVGNALLEKAPPARRKLIKDLVKATDATELMTQLMLTMTKAANRGVRLGQPDLPLPEERLLEQQWEAQRPAIDQMVAAVSLATFAMMYRSVPDSVLKQYLAFCNSPAGQHVNKESTHAFIQAVGNAIEDMSRNLSGAKDGNNI